MYIKNRNANTMYQAECIEKVMMQKVLQNLLAFSFINMLNYVTFGYK